MPMITPSRGHPRQKSEMRLSMRRFTRLSNGFSKGREPRSFGGDPFHALQFRADPPHRCGGFCKTARRRTRSPLHDATAFCERGGCVDRRRLVLGEGSRAAWCAALANEIDRSDHIDIQAFTICKKRHPSVYEDSSRRLRSFQQPSHKHRNWLGLQHRSAI
jgi:hypothetical protein